MCVCVYICVDIYIYICSDDTHTFPRVTPPFCATLDSPKIDRVSRSTERFNAGEDVRVDADFHPHFSSDTHFPVQMKPTLRCRARIEQS